MYKVIEITFGTFAISFSSQDIFLFQIGLFDERSQTLWDPDSLKDISSVSGNCVSKEIDLLLVE